MTRLAVFVLGLLGCERAATQERSVAEPTATARVEVLCRAVLCPSAPTDVAYSLRVSHSGLLGRQVDVALEAVVVVAKSDVAKWSAGCVAKPLSRKPAWAAALLQERGVTVSAAPDTFVCNGQERWVHVADGVVLLAVR